MPPRPLGCPSHNARPPLPPQAQILILGYHNTGTSMLAKLLLLMGAYGGAKSKLMIGDNNKLKYFERDDVVDANRALQ